MENNSNSKDVAESTHSIKNIFRKYAAQAGEKIYQISAACDDKLEYFRQDVCEMVSAGILVGDLVARRVYQGMLRMRGLHKACGVAAVDRKFEHHAESVMDDLREGRFSGAIEGIEHRQRRRAAFFDAASLKMHRVVKRVEARIDAVIEHFMENRKRWTVTMATVAGCFMMFCVTVNAGTVYNYYYHGTEIGTVKDKTEVAAAAEQVKETLPEDMKVNVDVNADPDVDITYEKEFSFSAAVDSAADVANKLVNSDELEANGYAIRVNGEVAALVDTEETASKIMETVRENYCTEPQTVTAADTSEDTDAVDADSVSAASDTAGSSSSDTVMDDISDDADASASIASAADAAAARSIILADSMNEKTGVVASAPAGKAADSIKSATGTASDHKTAVDYSKIDISSGDVTKLEGVTLDNVIIEDEVSVEPVTSKVSDFKDYEDAIGLFVDENGKSKIFNVSTAEIEVYNEPIAYTTVYEDTDTLYEGESEVKTQGVDGVKQIVARVTKENGQETAREVIQETVTTPAVDEVVLQGTKEKPSWVATGHFIQPANGRLSSNFGRRWGRQHQGIDIAASYGSDVVAADGGTVVYASYNSSGYGNLVKIDHGNGYVTYYGHNSKLCVSVGDKVYQGQVIAKIGSTGRSTGNHCHFEIRINGTPVNPISYLN